MQKKIDKKFIIIGTFAGVALLAFLTFMILVLCDYKFLIDKFNIFVANNRTSLGNGFFKIFTHIGSFYTLAALSLVGIALIWFVKKDKRLALFYGFGFAAVCVANFVCKRIVQRVRPLDLMIISETGYSFPSGHAMMIFAFFFLLAHFICKTMKNKPLKITLAAICGIVIAMVSFSRIYLGVHYLTDILAGWLLTFAVLSVLLIIYWSKLFIKKNKDQDIK